MSDQDDYMALFFIHLIILVIPMISMFLAYFGYELYGSLGFWIGLLICPSCFIIYLFWVICIVGNR